jgi:general secretion pathway protein N
MITRLFGGYGLTTLLLCALCAALGYTIYDELDALAPIGPAAALPGTLPAAAPPVPRAPEPAVFTLPPLDRYAEVVQRPLFAPTRQPPPPETVQDNQTKSSSFTLAAIIISGQGKVALIQHGKPPVLARLSVGQSVDGWTVQSVLPDRVVLERAAVLQELKLKDKPGAGVVTPPRPPTPAQVPR